MNSTKEFYFGGLEVLVIWFSGYALLFLSLCKRVLVWSPRMQGSWYLRSWPTAIGKDPPQLYH